MKALARYFIVFIMIVIFSCEDSQYNMNCEECMSEDPVETVLSADLDQQDETGILIRLYEGNMDTGILSDSVILRNTSAYQINVPVNRTYTLTATYSINGKKYTVVDSATPRVRYTETMCDEPCYFVYDRKLKLKLKYL